MREERTRCSTFYVAL